MREIVEELRHEALQLQGIAWQRPDGGQECCMAADLAIRAADRIEALEAELAARRAAPDRASVLEEALKPFATYLGESGDRDDNGNPLPDDWGVGWVYLTMGDFRRASAAFGPKNCGGQDG